MITLWNQQTGVAYLINEEFRRVFIRGHSAVPFGIIDVPLTPDERDDLQKRKSNFLGLPCRRDPAFALKDNKQVTIGEVCTSEELSMKLYAFREVERLGKKMRIEEELTEIRRGVEPDPAWFRLPAGYPIIDQSRPETKVKNKK